jgi:hypothetical protein
LVQVFQYLQLLPLNLPVGHLLPGLLVEHLLLDLPVEHPHLLMVGHLPLDPAN